MGTGDNLSNKKESVMEKSISILGSTGSIGRQTVDVAQRLGIKVRAITAGSDWKLLEEQARALRPQLAAVFDEKAAAQLKTALADTDIKVVSGMEVVDKIAQVKTGRRGMHADVPIDNVVILDAVIE